MGILLQFNRAISFEWPELVENTGLTPENLANNLIAIVKSKVVLIKPASAKIGAVGTSYELNTDFKSKRIRINLQMAIRSEQKVESDETHKTIEEDRKLLIQVSV